MATEDNWKGSVRKVYLYILLFTCVYALWIGLKMSEMLSAKEDIPELLRAAHSHTLCNSFILLFVLYDLRIKDRVEKLRIHWGLGEIILGIAIFGHLLITAGFSVAGIQPSMAKFGLSLADIGEPLMMFSLLVYIIVAILVEMYK